MERVTKQKFESILAANSLKPSNGKATTDIMPSKIVYHKEGVEIARIEMYPKGVKLYYGKN